MTATNGGSTLRSQGGALVCFTRDHATQPARTPDRRRRLRRRRRGRGGRSARRRPGAGRADDQRAVHRLGRHPAPARQVRRRADRRPRQRPRGGLSSRGAATPTSARRCSTASVTKLGGIDGRCARANVVSLGDGLARIKLKAFEGARADRDPRAPVPRRSGCSWARRRSTRSARPIPTGGPVGSATEVGDPLGDGAFVPSGNNGRVQVKVTGSFPHPARPGRPLHAARPTGRRWRARSPPATTRPTRTTRCAGTSTTTCSRPSSTWPVSASKACRLVTVDAVDNCRGPRNVAGLRRRLRPVLAGLRRSRQRRRGRRARVRSTRSARRRC